MVKPKSRYALSQCVGNGRFMAALDAGCASAGVPMRDVPALVGRTGYVHTRERTRKLRKRCHTPACFSLFPFYFLSLVFLSLPTLLFLQVFPFLQLNTINSGLSLRIIQKHCVSTSAVRLRKTLTVNHYLHIEYFQHNVLNFVLLSSIVLTGEQRLCLKRFPPMSFHLIRLYLLWW